MIDSIIQLDQTLFTFINTGLSSALLDFLLIPIRNKYVWLPLYIGLIAWACYRFHWRGFVFVFFAILTSSIADLTSSRLVKLNVERTRPCNTEIAGFEVVERIHCGSGYSFTSSHATNHMSLAVFIFFTLGYTFRKQRWLWIFWAVSIGFAQVYVGVHYPFDVLGGFLLGFLIGWAIAVFYRTLELSRVVVLGGQISE